MEEFGSYLKSQREKKGIRLEEIASITKIHLHNLELLESGKLEQLPPEPFIRGFITAYAKYVGLSPKETIDKYLLAAGLVVPEEATAATPTAAVMVPTNPPMARPPMSMAGGPGAADVLGKFQLPSWPKLVTAAGVFFVAGVSILLIQVGKNADAPVADTASTAIPTQVEMVAETPPTGAAADSRNVAANTAPTANPSAAATIAAAALPTPTAAVAPAPSAAAPAAGAKPHLIEIEGSERTWVKVVLDGEAPVEFFLSPGKKAQYSAQTKFKVVLGNATNAKVIHNGQEADGKRFMGTIKSFRYPAGAQFPQDVPKPADPAAQAPGSEEKKDD